MLVLTRKVGESIDIGPDVKVRVLEFRGKTVKLGISAPPAVVVDRDEVTRRKRNGVPHPRARV